MRNKIIIFLIVIIAGFTSGYYSDSISRFFSEISFAEVNFNALLSFRESEPNLDEAGSDHTSSLTNSKGVITADDAIKAVKSVPIIKQRMSNAVSKGSQVVFKADQPPTRDYPVWLVETREIHPNEIPDILFIKVNAKTGKILDLMSTELVVDGLKPGSSAPESMNSYTGIQVQTVRDNKIAGITVKDQSIRGPRGLGVGDAKTTVIGKLGKANIAQDNLLIYNCLDNHKLQLQLKVDQKDKVTEFTILDTSN